MPPFLSVIIPAYNEEQRLPATLEAMAKHLATHPDWETETLVVDDGSKDGTRAMVQEWTSRFPGLRLVVNPQNLGKGATIQHGMRAAVAPWRLFADADNSTPFGQVDALIQVAQERNAQVVFGSRAIRGAKLEKRQPLRRELMGRVFNLMVQAIVLPGIRDTQCGFKLFSAEAAEAIFPRLTCKGFSFDVEALYLGKKLGFTLAEVPVRWINDERSSVSAIRDSWEMAKDLWKVRRLHRNVRRES